MSPTLTHAQMKVGSNATTLATDANLQVEATTNVSDSGQFVVQKSTGNVGIGTVSPANKLHIGAGAVANTAGIRTPLTNAATLATNTNGDIVAGVAACTCGDVKTGLQTADHGSWKLLDGRTHNCGTISTSANTTTAATYPASGGTLGNVSGSNTKTIARNQLPNVRLYVLNDAEGGFNFFGGAATQAQKDAYIRSAHEFTSVDVDNYYLRASTSEPNMGRTSSINGNVTQQDLDITPRTLSVNYFVCIN